MPADAMGGAVYVQTNEPENRVVAFVRSADGTLDRSTSHPTGGAGDGQPHLASQGSVVLTGDGRHLLVCNAGGDDVSVFAVDSDDVQLLGRTSVGARPKSVTERDGLVYVLATGTPELRGFRLTGAGLETLPSGPVPLSPGSDPAQVSFAPGGSALVVTERGTDSITTFPVQADGSLGPAETTPSSGPTPYGFAFTSNGTLVVTEAFRAEKGAAAASSYSLAGTALTPITRSAGNGRSEICWAVTSADDRFAFTTNFADGAVSRYTIGADGRLTLDDAAAAITIDGRAGLRDEARTPDGRFLYAIDADSGSIFGWAIGDDGTLSATGSWGGLPVTVAGIAAS